ncbi:N-6 DNA methylase [Halorubrum sp. GN11GM_10-3_MGM]|uniref:N-6 DNA methylase n=1 Tax=Halorubrum sp. GN11GM_10-3_MGM TaxID=2518111 RepID=UPI0010F4559D|nr:N-6 DNA methylase [Halorubrum sp. GN11GM_10-3_MGM]TKX72189.1 hypothetical protein EXE40_04925 [Halorubrum sp. GN11GM_10-3_MGM]
MPNPPEDDHFADSLGDYLDRIDQANSEASLGHQFLLFIQDTFGGLDSGQADDLLPFLEEYVQTDEAAVAINGRIDARLGNVLVEFKTDLDRDLGDARSQLKRYITAIWENQGRDQDYYLIASDGLKCIVYTASHVGDEMHPDQVQLTQVDEIDLEDGDPDWIYTQLDRYLLYSEDINPTAGNIVRDFGPDSPVHREAIELLEENWDDCRDEDAAVLFDEWKRYLEIVHGSDTTHSDELYLRHTYLSTLAKLMAYIQYTGGDLPDESEVSDVITGEIFEQHGIQNFIEEDFFTWVCRESASGTDEKIVEAVAARLRDYDLQSVEEDVLKELYQHLVTPQERHNLGEYYTPDWLVEEIVNEELEGESEASVLDPACGSGTFLFQSIHYKREQSELEGEELLDHLLRSVVGMDIHPLALIISRVNYLLALGDLLRDHRSGSVSIPVYLSNSIMPPSFELSNQAVEVYRFESSEGTFEMPVAVTEGDDDLTEVLDRIRDYLDSNEEISERNFHAYLERNVESYGDLEEVEKSLIYDSITSQIKDLQERDRDTIWTFILKNVYKPVYLEEVKFDRVLGNPPWLSYRYIGREEYEDHVKDLIINEYGLLESDDVENITHMELAALFFVYSLDNYVKDDTEDQEGGRISFVVPRAVINGDHLDQLRRMNVDVPGHLSYLWDLRDVKPLFNNLTAVVAADKAEGESYPLPSRDYHGNLSSANIGLDTARDQLSIDEKTLYLNELGSRTVLMNREVDPELFNEESRYNSEVSQGATITPRNLWFVDFNQSSAFGINPDAPVVKSSYRATERAKERWSGVEMQGQIESKFLHHCITGSELIHFTHLEIPTAVLPVLVSGNDFHILDEEAARQRGYQHLAEWLSDANQKWDENKGSTNDLDLQERIDYRGTLNQQNPNPRYRVLQNTSGSYVYGSVLDTAELGDIDLNGTTIELQRTNEGRVPIIIDHKCYYYETDNRDEAYYLSGFLNAPLILELIEEMMSQGLFGGRDIHKRVWEIAIPEYDPEDEVHREIRDKAIEGEEIAEEMIPELLEEYNPLTALNWIRIRQRERMEPLRDDLSELCIEALEEAGTAQSGLENW